ncbi:MAG: hypothetical protein KUG80_03535 [Gammaproteobacteria bacterium]|nr:hypothetical protein [Gammaproteobacteria bacterium]
MKITNNNVSLSIRILLSIIFSHSLIAIAENSTEKQANPYILNIETATVNKKDLKKALAQIQEIREVNIKENLAVQAFHFRDKIQTDNNQAFCFQCHTNPPHRKNEASRTFQNMHARFIDCTTCHYKEKNKNLKYQWLDKHNESITLSTTIQNKALMNSGGANTEAMQSEQDRSLSIIPEKGAKITAFYKNKPINILINSPFSKNLEEKWLKANEGEKAHIKVTLHQALKNKGTQCKTCHNDQQKLLNWTSLGASEEQILSIEKNPIPRFIDKANEHDKRIQLNGLLE